jgi:hypothetical protein
LQIIIIIIIIINKALPQPDANQEEGPLTQKYSAPGRRCVCPNIYPNRISNPQPKQILAQ